MGVLQQNRQRSAQSHQKGAASAPSRGVPASSASSGAPYLDSGKNFDKDHPVMDRLGWPLERFSCENSVAPTSHHTRRRGRTDMGHLMDYCKFLQTQAEA